MSRRIAIVTGGGDCPGLNAVIRHRQSASIRGWEVVGILGGCEEEIATARQRSRPELSGGRRIADPRRHHSRHGQSRPLFRQGRARPESNFACGTDSETKRGLEQLGVSAFIAIGGDGTLSIAEQLHESGIPVVGVPKTIDDDLSGTIMTFGFDSAVACATDALDRLHTTAESHDRVMVLEVMGRYAGWIAMYAGVAGGADVILIPEIPFDYESVCTVRRQTANLADASFRSSSLPKVPAKKGPTS